jgi:lambda repressor-like predicted transcriptional regulator
MLIPVATKRRRPNRGLTTLRINAGLSPNALAYRAGLCGKTIRMAEAGWVPTPRVQFAIASVFGKQPTDIWPLDRQMVGR